MGRIVPARHRLHKKIITIPEFYEKRNRLLIVRHSGGLGDILMHRMIFEDFKLLVPDIHITFALPCNYWEAVDDHPFIDEIADCNTVDPNEYLVHYCTTTACGRYENKTAPFGDKHRSDIWAEHCGVQLTRHNMHITLTDSQKEVGKRLLEPFSRPVVVFCPISAMTGKNLDSAQIQGTVAGMRDMGLSVVGLHYTPIDAVETLTGFSTKEWMSVLWAADYVVSVDTSAFHCAGGLGKKLVGIFSWADSLVYGKHYDFIPVQKHRDWTPGWTCGPCFNWSKCTKCQDPHNMRKPCITEITVEDILAGVRKMTKQTTELKQVRGPVSC